MSQMNLDISSWQVVWPRCVVIGGLSMIFAPLNVAAFLYIPAPGCMAPPSVSLRCCATRAAASAPASPKPFTSDATNYIVCTLVRRLQAALQTGDRFEIDACQTYWLKVAKTLRRLEVSIDLAIRNRPA
jgi:hypothetical protein